MTLTWNQVFAWRMRQQMLDPLGTAGPDDIVRRLCGVQAQVASSAELAIRVRQKSPGTDEVGRALADGSLMKTWAMRGTLHLLTPEDAGAYLALLAATKSWEKPSWQRTFGVTAKEMAQLAEVVSEALEGKVLSRDELVTEIVARTGNRHFEEQLRSGWGVVFKPLACMGYLCNGPNQGNRVTFTRPDTYLKRWGGVPEPIEASKTAIPAYLSAYGPASAETFDRWLTRGASKKSELRSWFADLADRLVTVDVEGEKCHTLAEHVDELAATKPTKTVRLLPGFDQYVLGPGTGDTRVIPSARRAEVSRTAGWISPVVVAGGRVVGVWDADGGSVAVRLFAEAGEVPRKPLETEATRIAKLLGRKLSLSATTV